MNQKTVQRACAINEMKHARVGEGSKAQYRIKREWLDAWMTRFVCGGD